MTLGELTVSGHDVEQARAGLERLRGGSTRWMSRNANHLHPAGADRLPPVPRVKASTELAMLARLWTRTRPDDADLRDIDTVVRTIWQDPAVPRQVVVPPTRYRQFALVYAALAPEGLPTRHHRDVLEEVVGDGYLEPYGGSPYLRLEARYYADLAGLRHGFESYRELYDAGLLASLTSAPIPMDIHGAYEISHTLFHITDFGRHDHGLPDHERDRALGIVDELTDHFVDVEHWDLTAELVLAQFCLGADPAATRSGAAAIRCLLDAQTPGGAIPGRFAGQRLPETAEPLTFFRRAFHTTLVTAIMSLIVLSSSPVS